MVHHLNTRTKSTKCLAENTGGKSSWSSARQMLVREDTEGLKHKRKKIGALHIIIMKISCSKLQRQAENWETNKQTKLAKDLSPAYGNKNSN